MKITLTVPPSKEELDEAFYEGYAAAEEGKPEIDFPIIRSDLECEWLRGWEAWHEQRDEESPGWN